MTSTIPAVYEGGVFRPTAPVPLADGATVELTVAPVPTPDELEERIRAAQSLQELWAAMAEAADDEPDDGFDIIEALNRTRVAEGRPPIQPEAYRVES